MMNTSEKLFDAASAIGTEPVPDEQRVTGHPQTGTRELGEISGTGFGLWQMTAGSMSDTEADEVFVVLSGAASVQFVDRGISMKLSPGDVVRLVAGERTLWTVTETLRKLYLG